MLETLAKRILPVFAFVIAVVGAAGGQGRGQAVPPANLPESPTPVALPEVSGPVTGPGTMYESVQSLAPGKGLSNFNYEAKEYFVSGTANGKPYKTRVVVRKPVNNATFNGLVLAEPMHPSGSAHMFEFTSIYGMSTGYISIDMLIGGMQQVIDHNPERYKDFKIEPSQNNEVIAQIGALISQVEPEQRSDGRPPCEKDDPGRHVGNRRDVDQLPAGAHGVPHAGHAANLRRLHADIQRLGHPPG